MSTLLPLRESLVPFLKAYLPQGSSQVDTTHPFVTLTYAQSIDSRISESPGTQTVISHLETKSMTHYLRSCHDAILIGINTFVADDPGLNCRHSDHKIRPIIVDPHFKSGSLLRNSKMLKLSKSGEGMAPILVVSDEAPVDRTLLQELNIEVLFMPNRDGKLAWVDIFYDLKESFGIGSVMVEGGATVINDLLTAKFPSGASVVNSLVVTIGPVFLGSNGVQVSPVSKTSLQNVSWWTGIQDSVMAARLL